MNYDERLKKFDPNLSKEYKLNSDFLALQPYGVSLVMEHVARNDHERSLA